MTQGGTITVVCAVVVAMTALLGFVFGVPAWRTARHTVRVQAKADRNAEILEALVEILNGGGVVLPRSPEHPSISDLLEEIRDNTAEVAWMGAAFAMHVADDHGGAVVVRPRHPRPRR